MKIRILSIAAMMAISSIAVYAQRAENFRQPYPLGDKLSPNPNFTGEVWLAPVSDKQYEEATGGAETRHAEANKGLAPREQAIVAVASYTGKGDLENLRQAFVQALDAGMTVNEINEVLIHAYAYCGFPRSLRAIQTFMQIVEKRKADGITDAVGRARLWSKAAPRGEAVS